MHKEKIGIEKGQKVFGQKVAAEISCSGISSGREGGKVCKKAVLESLDC